jgi:hypothetical protein
VRGWIRGEIWQGGDPSRILDRQRRVFVDSMTNSSGYNTLRTKDTFPHPRRGKMGRGERKELVERYLPRICATHIESELVCSFHPSLEIRAKLTSFIF